MACVSFEVTFSVRANTRPGEIVCLTGNRKEFGNWELHRAVKLKRETSRRPTVSDSEIGMDFIDGDVWSRKVKLNGLEECEFRYFVCRNLLSDNEEGEESILVSRWETNIKPRKFSPKSVLKTGSGDIELAVFGEYDGRKQISTGWLTDQCQVHIRLHDSPIKMWKPRYKDQLYSVKCTPVDRSKVADFEEEEEDGPPHPAGNTDVLVSVLEKGHSKPVVQGPYGIDYTPGAFVTFAVQTLDPENVGFHLDFYVHDTSEAAKAASHPRHIGYSFILPLEMKLSSDKKTIPINGLKHKPIGQLTFDYLLVKPMIDQKFDMRRTYQMYWKSGREGLDVGHRGMGMTYSYNQCCKLAMIRENTVASLMSAASHGADFVEFDVHLTKDKIPIIYHDFKVYITYRKKRREELEQMHIPVKDLKLAELQSMKLSHTATPENVDEIHADDLDPEDLQPFPTLAQCFDAVDSHTGFNIEIKYPQEMLNGQNEQDHYFDLNEFVDIILKVVFKHSNGRRIVFSSFSPDCCVALRLKQNLYPVLFLTQADSKVFEDCWYKDDRARVGVTIAAEFALAQSLLGVDVSADLLLQDMSLIKYIKDAGLVLFVWGEDSNDSNVINTFKQSGVHGIIYDRIDHFKTSRKESVFKMERDQKLGLLQKFGSNANGRLTIDLLEDSESGSDS